MAGICSSAEPWRSSLGSEGRETADEIIQKHQRAIERSHIRVQLCENPPRLAIAADLLLLEKVARSNFTTKASDLELRGGAPLPDNATGGLIAAEELKLIVSALRKARHNVTNTAHALGISRDTLRYRMAKYGLSRDVF